jgi:hypothetical protein
VQVQVCFFACFASVVVKGFWKSSFFLFDPASTLVVIFLQMADFFNADVASNVEEIRRLLDSNFIKDKMHGMKALMAVSVLRFLSPHFVVLALFFPFHRTSDSSSFSSLGTVDFHWPRCVNLLF